MDGQGRDPARGIGMMAERGTVSVFPDAEATATAAAALFTEEAARCVDARGRFSVVLAGGGTPRRTYELLSRPPFRDQIPWDGVHVFWGDERCVEPDDPRSNERMAREAFLDAVPIPPDRIHPVRCGDSPAGAATRYDSLLRAFFSPPASGPDLVFLGLGDNGHTASLFPHSPALTEQERWVVEAFVDAAAGAGTTAAGQDLWRVTLTAPFFNRAETIVFLVTGSGKARVAKKVIQGDDDPDRLPAQLISPASGGLRWYLDEAAAALLEPTRP